jgi:glucose-6-phosphate isomerase
VRAEGTDEAIVPARVFSGNRPTTSIMAPALTQSVLGQLLAKQVTPAMGGDESAIAEQDGSTQSLVRWYRAHREG